MRWMNQTKSQVPRMAAAKAKRARLHRVELGRKRRASRIPSWAEEMVAPVVGETNLLLQSCCMMSPATLIPTPVHKIASRRGRREIRKTFHRCASPDSRSEGVISMTPTKREQMEQRTSSVPKRRVDLDALIRISPSCGDFYS